MHEANSANSLLRAAFSLCEGAERVYLYLLTEMLNEVSALQRQF